MDSLRPGDPSKVGKYVLSARLGAGGMGEVFFGRSPGGRPVAVKLIHKAYAADVEFRRRFKREVEACRRVGGFHTAPVVDADSDATLPWMVTAYVAGPSLGQALAEQGPLSSRTLRVLGAGLAEALEAIHEAGLIHRDLKPSNVLLADDGPRVIDFGIARAADASGVTARAGTPGFMSPELLTGKTLTPACDVFAFGLVLAHAAGIRPFGEGPADALNHRIIHQEPDISGLDRELAGLVRSCLAKTPAERPAPTSILNVLAGAEATRDWLPPTVQTMISTRTLSVDSVPGIAHAAAPMAAPPSRSASASHDRSQHLDPAGVVFRSAGPLWGVDRSLQITPEGIEVEIGSDCYRFGWTAISKIDVKTDSDGRCYACLYPQPHIDIEPPTRHKRSTKRPFVLQSGRVVLPVHGWGAPTGQIIDALAGYAGPLWDGVKSLYGRALS